ncbi:helix-turn-helix transcriptional regulator [Streptomyces sp. NPDC050619]|uniref:helix-turn-helix domain-containing protein n=1 Tax=Streptomyces sp. NPDC050619 TaxID=3157214 RepID=UPI0034125A5D
MPLRDNPTARQIRLGAELRKLRESAGKTAREVAGLLSTDQAKISHIEAGRIGVSEERLRRLAVFYACDDADLVEALCVIARESRGQGWWDAYRGVLVPGFLNIAELEYHATYLRSVQAMNVPGILQTEDYIRAIHRSYTPALPAEEVDVRVEFRMKRRSIFERDAPPPFLAVVHEAALRMRFGGRKVAKGQLEYLLEASERPTVTVRVIPFTCEEFIEATYPLLYARGVVPQLDTVQMDSPVGGYFITAAAQLKRFAGLLDIAEQSSLGEPESRQLIQQIAREL